MAPKYCQFCMMPLGPALYRHVGTSHRSDAQECGWSSCDECLAMFPNERSLKLHKGHTHSRKHSPKGSQEISSEKGSDESANSANSNNNEVKTQMSPDKVSSPKILRARRESTKSSSQKATDLVPNVKELPMGSGGKGRGRKSLNLQVSFAEENDQKADSQGGQDNTVVGDQENRLSPLDERRRLAERKEIEEKYELVISTKETMKGNPYGFYFPASARYMCEVCNKILMSSKSFVNHIEIHREILDQEVLHLLKRRISADGRASRKRQNSQSAEDSTPTPSRKRRTSEKVVVRTDQGSISKKTSTGIEQDEIETNMSKMFGEVAESKLKKTDQDHVSKETSSGTEPDEIEANMSKMFGDVANSKLPTGENNLSSEITLEKESLDLNVVSENETDNSRIVKNVVNRSIDDHDGVDESDAVLHEDDPEQPKDGSELTKENSEMAEDDSEMVEDQMTEEKSGVAGDHLEVAEDNLGMAHIESESPLNNSDNSEMATSISDMGGDQSELIGDESKLAEDESKLAGDESKLIGDQSELNGDQSELNGDQSELIGGQSELIGDQSELAGDESELAGDESELAGDESKLAGDESKLAGDESNLAGDNLEVSGSNEIANQVSNVVSVNQENGVITKQVSGKKRGRKPKAVPAVEPLDLHDEIVSQSEDGPEHAGAVMDSKPSPKKRGRPARKCRSK